MAVAAVTLKIVFAVVVIGGINAAYAVLGARARHFFADANAQRTLHRVAGTLMPAWTYVATTVPLGDRLEREVQAPHELGPVVRGDRVRWEAL